MEGDKAKAPTLKVDSEEKEAGSCGGEVTVEEAARRQKMQEYREELTRRAKKNADNLRPPTGISLLARPLNMGYHFGVGIGLYFQMLEWLIILFSCITLLAIPFWIVINQSVFLDEANKNKPEFGFKVHADGTNLLESTFAAIIGARQDPNNTLTYMLTKLGDTWHGPQTKDSFLLWISILDVVGVVLMIFLVTYFTWKADKFEDKVDKDSYDVTDFTVVVSGLPLDAGVHEVGAFFSKYGDIMDVTLVLDMERVLLACAKTAKLDQKRVSLFQQLDLLPTHLHDKIKCRISKVEDEIISSLKAIDDDMNRRITTRAPRQAKKAKAALTLNPLGEGPPIPAEVVGSDKNEDEPISSEEEEELASFSAEKLPTVAEDPQSGPHLGELKKDNMETKRWDGKSAKKFTKKAVYNTKAAFVTFNRLEDQQNCLKATANPGWRGWFLGHVLADADHEMRGHILATSRAQAPNNYIFENMCMLESDRLWRVLGIRTLYLVMLIACALIVSGLSSRTRVDLDLTKLSWVNLKLAVDIARAGEAIPAGSTDPPSAQLRGLYEEAMQEAASQATTPAYSVDLAIKANFTDFCRMALGVCADFYNKELGGGDDNVTLSLEWGKHFMWGEPHDRFTYERRLMRKLDDRSLMGDKDPTDFQGADIALTACAACYCRGLNVAEEEEQNTFGWLSLTQSHCWAYTFGEPSESGTEAAVSVVIAVLNVILKIFVQYLAGQEKQWTRSAMEKSFCVVAYISQLLNSVLVVLLVNARTNSKLSNTGERINEDDIGWLRYIILGGAFDDFSNGWYDYVGESFMILLFIQTIFPLINVLMEFLKSWARRLLLRFYREPTQDAFDAAYQYPDFLLQQRVADVMLNVSVALLFCSGMPLCAGVVVLVFCVASLFDRYAVTTVMHVTQYDSQLPRLVLGLLPWAVFFHCCFGLWQHSYFMMQDWDNRHTSVFADTGKEQLEPGIDSSTPYGFHITNRSVKSRIGQPNAFGLLLVAFIMAVWLINWNTVGWFLPYFRDWVEKKEKHEKGLKMKSRLRLLRKLLAMRDIDVFGKKGPADPDEGRNPTFEECLAAETLRSLPTYRLPFHPRFAQIFNNGLLSGVLWFKMYGPNRYTRLVPMKVMEPHIPYFIKVKTSDRVGAGTDANVLICIFGIKDGKVATTGRHHLDKAGNDFERGQTDEYHFSSRDVGAITHIEIRSCGTGFGAAWHLEKVTVTDQFRDLTYDFPCGRWLTPKQPKSLVQTLNSTHINGKEVTQDHASKGIKMSAAAIADLARVGAEEGKLGTSLNEFMSAISAAREAEREATDEISEDRAPDDPEAAICPKVPRGKVVMHTRLGWKITHNLLLKVDSHIDNDFLVKELQKDYGMSEKLASYVASIATSTQKQ